MLTHGAYRAGVTAEFDDRHNRMADDVALTRREQVNSVTGGGLQGVAFSSSRGGVHEVQARAFGWCFRRL